MRDAPPDAERVLGRPGTVGEIRTLGDTPGRRHVVTMDWRGQPPQIRPVNCRVGSSFGPQCQGFKYRRTCSHAERAVAFVRAERSRIVGADPSRVAPARRPPHQAAPEEAPPELDLMPIPDLDDLDAGLVAALESAGG